MNNFYKYVISMVFIAFVNIGGQSPSLANDNEDMARGFEAAQKGDFKTALKFWQPLADKGNASAQYNLGVMYAKGEGVLQDKKQAVKWYTAAAEQGNAEAQTTLGYLYYTGTGVLQDKIIAHMWFNIAAIDGIERAKMGRDSIVRELHPEKIDKALELAKACIAQKYKNCGR